MHQVDERLRRQQILDAATVDLGSDYDAYGLPQPPRGSAPTSRRGSGSTMSIVGKLRKNYSPALEDGEDDYGESSLPEDGQFPDVSIRDLSGIRDRHRYPTFADDNASTASGDAASDVNSASLAPFDTTPIIPTFGSSPTGKPKNGSMMYRQKLIDNRRQMLSNELYAGGQMPQPRADSMSSFRGAPEGNSPRTMSLGSQQGQPRRQAPNGQQAQWRHQGQQNYQNYGHYYQYPQGQYYAQGYGQPQAHPQQGYPPQHQQHGQAPHQYAQQQQASGPTTPHMQQNSYFNGRSAHNPSVQSPLANEIVALVDKAVDTDLPQPDFSKASTASKSDPAESATTVPRRIDPDLEAEHARLLSEVRMLSIELAESTRRELGLNPSSASAQESQNLAQAFKSISLEREKVQLTLDQLGPDPKVLEYAQVQNQHAEATHLLELRSQEMDRLQQSTKQLTADLADSDRKHEELQGHIRDLGLSRERSEQELDLPRQIEDLRSENTRLTSLLHQHATSGTEERLQLADEQREALQQALRSLRERKDQEISKLNHRIESLEAQASRQSRTITPSVRQFSASDASLHENKSGRPPLNLSINTHDKDKDVALEMPRLRDHPRPASPLNISFDIAGARAGSQARNISRTSPVPLALSSE